MSNKAQIKLPGFPSEERISWLAQNVGPRTHYLHHSIGGKGWRMYNRMGHKAPTEEWVLEFDEPSYATWYILLWK